MEHRQGLATAPHRELTGDPDRWQQVKAILGPALELPADQVTDFLDQNCAEEGFRQQVRTFLRAFHCDGEFLDHPVDLGRCPALR